MGRLVHALYVWIRDGFGVLAEQLRSLAVPLASRPRGISTTSVFPVPLLREKTGPQAKSSSSWELANLWIACLNELHAGRGGIRHCHFLPSAAQARIQESLLSRARVWVRSASDVGLSSSADIRVFFAYWRFRIHGDWRSFTARKLFQIRSGTWHLRCGPGACCHSTSDCGSLCSAEPFAHSAGRVAGRDPALSFRASRQDV